MPPVRGGRASTRAARLPYAESRLSRLILPRIPSLDAMLLAGSPLVRGASVHAEPSGALRLGTFVGTRCIALKLHLFLTKIIGAGQEKLLSIYIQLLLI
jgi:hypothetical protein